MMCGWRVDRALFLRSTVGRFFKEIMKYRYREPDDIGTMRGITPSVKFLLIVNVAVFLLQTVLDWPLREIFALRADWFKSVAFGQLFTYMFVHGDGGHILMNMLSLFFIGPSVERTLGSYRFFTLYYLSGILGGLGWSLLAPAGSSCIGASGAVFGVLGAFAAFYPNARVALIFLPFLPIRAWIFVSVLILFELFQTIGNPVIGGIANAAHLIGGIAGFCYAFSLLHPHIILELRQKLTGRKPAPRPPSGVESTMISREDMDRILDKIGKEGMGSLTHQEREMLKRAVRR